MTKQTVNRREFSRLIENVPVIFHRKLSTVSSNMTTFGLVFMWLGLLLICSIMCVVYAVIVMYRMSYQHVSEFSFLVTLLGFICLASLWHIYHSAPVTLSKEEYDSKELCESYLRLSQEEPTFPVFIHENRPTAIERHTRILIDLAREIRNLEGIVDSRQKELDSLPGGPAENVDKCLTAEDFVNAKKVLGTLRYKFKQRFEVFSALGIVESSKEKLFRAAVS